MAYQNPPGYQAAYPAPPRYQGWPPAARVNPAVLVGVTVYPLFTLGRRHEPRSPWWRGATTVVMVDWLLVGRSQANTKLWHPLTWLLFPLAYLVYYVSADLSLYEFLDPSEGAALGGVIVGFMFALLALGFALLGTGKLKAAIARGVR